MPAKTEFRSVTKHCLTCDTPLVLRNNRDIIRKKFCSRSCLCKHYSAQLSRMAGCRHSEDTKRRISLATTGSNNPRYKPLRDLVIRPLSSFEGRRWREAVYQRDDYTCQDCGHRGGRLHSHHIKSFKNFPHLRWNTSNGLTLCVECHKETNTYGWKGLNYVTC